MKPKLLVLMILSFTTACVGQPTIATPFSPAPMTVVVTETSIPTATQEPCLSGGDQNTINAKLNGPNKTAVLCPGAVFELTDSVIISADGQQIYTEGFPTDDTRAMLRIVSSDLSTAVYMRDFNNAILSHVVVDGNRPNLGYKGGDALIYAGGSSSGQVIRSVKIMEPRSWSALQLIEGHPAPEPPCSNALVEDNEIGPAGQSDGTWADGISLSCTNTTVRNNLIVDATDGGIVIFAAPGSVIEGNTVRAKTRVLLGGINMVDYAPPYKGDYTGTIVRNNVIDADGAVIRIGLGMGVRVWGCLPENAENDTIFGGTVIGNTLRGEWMQYGFAISGVRDWTAIDNVSEATHSGVPTVECRGRVAAPPSAFLFDPERAQGTFQPEFLEAYLDLALMAVPNPPMP